MGDDAETVQETEWENLYGRISVLLQQFGDDNPIREGDYWLVDENWGIRQQKLEVQNLALLAPAIVEQLQALLAELPAWEIVLAVDVPGKEDVWPGMGLIIDHRKIIDGLERQFLPAPFKEFEYQGSRRANEIDRMRRLARVT
jgi:hypothetical protein